MNLDEAEKLARRLMDENGLSHWHFDFDRASRRFGSCDWARRLITLSWKLTALNETEQVRQTILHEIAHAMSPGDGHGYKWRSACARLGIEPTRCYTDAEVKSPARQASRYEIGCARCNTWNPRFRRPTRMMVCRQCSSAAVIRDRSTGRSYQMRVVGTHIQFEPVAP